MTLLLFTLAASIGAMIWGWPGLFIGGGLLWALDAISEYLWG